MISRYLLLLSLAGSTLLAGPLAAQVQPTPRGPTVVAPRTGDGWNDARVAALLERGRQRRAEPLADTLLQSYRARAEGSIYFYIDPDAGDPVLMRADQVAVDLYWAAPDQTRQVLIGQRIEKRLPIRDFHYYIDRLTVVQNGFADEIQVGEGMDVRSVLHPLAAGAEHIYDFRLSDSLTLRLPGAAPIRAYEIVVQPRDMNAPGFVGSLYLDDASGALVRMAFGFTRSSYVDPRNDYVRINVDHGLWRGRYWLPNEQQVVVRRELPELDLRAGTIIRATLRVTDYDFEPELTADFFRLPVVSAVPRVEREAYGFERGLYDDLIEAGLAPGRGLQALEADARRILREQVVSGLPRTRLAAPTVSDVLRYNRAEGLFLGAGIRAGSPAASVLLQAGHAFGPGRPVFAVTAATRMSPAGRLEARGYLRELRDVGPQLAAPGGLNTLAALALGRDYLDPYHADGARLAFARQAGAATLRLWGSVERHRAAAWTSTASPFGAGAFRPVRPVEEGLRHAVGLSVERPLVAYRTWTTGTRISAEGGDWRNHRFALLAAEGSLGWTSASLAAGGALRMRGGTALGAAPPQHHTFLGGAGTLPGHPFRAYGGRSFVLAEAEATRDLGHPWIAGRVFGAAGWTGSLEPAVAALWGAADGEVRGSVGLGVALLHRILRLDAAWGVNGGGPALLLSIDPRFRPWM